MAYDFPSNPANGQVYQDYVYDSASGWRSQVMVGASPCGSIMPFAGATIPAGWLLCNGAAVSRTTYSSLFAALGGISSPWGLGDGSTTFNVPDLRNRVPTGKGSETFGTLGAIGGAETMSLQEAHLAAHTHTFSGTTSNNGNHNHAPPVAVSYGGSAGNYRNLLTTNTPLWSGADWNCAVSVGGDHNHTYSGTTSSKGSGQSFGILQPYAVVNYIIKFSAVIAATDTELAVRVGQAEAAANAATLAVASKANVNAQTFTGLISTPDHPYFFARTSGSPIWSSTDPVFDSAVYNVGNCYNTSNGRFTAPKAGYYLFTASFFSVINYGGVGGFKVNGGAYEVMGGREGGEGYWSPTTISHVRYLAVNDYVTLNRYTGQLHSNNVLNSFSGRYLG